MFYISTLFREDSHGMATSSLDLTIQQEEIEEYMIITNVWEAKDRLWYWTLLDYLGLHY